jgi:hypothetical protein
MSISALLGHKVKRTSASPNHKTSAARGADSGLIQRKKRRLREWRIFSEESRKFSMGEKGESGLEFWGKFADFRPIMVPPVRILFARESLRATSAFLGIYSIQNPYMYDSVYVPVSL